MQGDMARWNRPPGSCMKDELVSTNASMGTSLMKIRTILDQIDLGSMALPEFQRGYVGTATRSVA